MRNSSGLETHSPHRSRVYRAAHGRERGLSDADDSPLTRFDHRSARCFQQFARVFANVAVRKHGISGYKNFCPGANNVSDCVERNTAVDFDAEL